MNINTIKKFIVKGSVRGLISTHRLAHCAHKSAARDREACYRLGGGAYSDVKVYAVHNDGTASIVLVAE